MVDILIFRIDSTSSVPVYVQLIEQVKRAIASGGLRKGEILPSRRELALELEINPLTVLKAYKELESEGLITIRQGLGCFVAAEPEPAVDKYRKQTLMHAIDGLINDARDFGVSFDELDNMIHERIDSARAKQESDGEEQNGGS